MEWKYAKLKNLKLDDFAKSAMRPNHEEFKSLAAKVTGETYNIVLLNGELDRTLSSMDALPAGVKISQSKRQFSDPTPDRFSLPTETSLEIELSPNQSLDRPIKLVLFQSGIEVGSGDGISALSQPQVFVKIGKFSKAQILLESVGRKDSKYFLNGRMQFDVEESANLEVSYISEESVESYQLWRILVRPQKDASVRTLFSVLDTGIGRAEVYIPVGAENITNQFLALGTLKGKSQFDLQTLIDHSVGDSTTSQICKFIADDESRGSFGGKVVIAKNAQKTAIEQLNQNILLSKKAEIDSEPMLEIDADDVKASHGSTVGGLDQQEIFYLQSRAIPKQKALKILSFGFVNELAQKLQNPILRAQTESRLRHHFGGQL